MHTFTALHCTPLRPKYIFYKISSTFLRWSVLGPTLVYIGPEPTFFKSHQIPKNWTISDQGQRSKWLYRTRANTTFQYIGPGPTSPPRVHLVFVIQVGHSTSLNPWYSFHISMYCGVIVSISYSNSRFPRVQSTYKFQV